MHSRAKCGPIFLLVSITIHGNKLYTFRTMEHMVRYLYIYAHLWVIITTQSPIILHIPPSSARPVDTLQSDTDHSDSVHDRTQWQCTVGE